MADKMTETEMFLLLVMHQITEKSMCFIIYKKLGFVFCSKINVSGIKELRVLCFILMGQSSPNEFIFSIFHIYFLRFNPKEPSLLARIYI